MDTTNWTVEDSVTGVFTPDEAAKYWEKLKVKFISFLDYPRVFCDQSKFPVKIGQVPPIVHPLVAGREMFNTEHMKNSYILKNINEIQGSQNKMIELIVSGEFDVTNLDNMNNEDLRTICEHLDFEQI